MKNFNSIKEINKFIAENFSENAISEIGNHWSDGYEGKTKTVIEIDDKDTFVFCKDNLEGELILCSRKKGAQIWENSGSRSSSDFKDALEQIKECYRYEIENKSDDTLHYDANDIKIWKEEQDEDDEPLDFSWYVGAGYYNNQSPVLLEKDYATMEITNYDIDAMEYQLCFLVDKKSMIKAADDEQ